MQACQVTPPTLICEQQSMDRVMPDLLAVGLADAKFISCNRYRFLKDLSQPLLAIETVPTGHLLLLTPDTSIVFQTLDSGQQHFRAPSKGTNYTPVDSQQQVATFHSWKERHHEQYCLVRTFYPAHSNC